MQLVSQIAVCVKNTIKLLSVLALSRVVLGVDSPDFMRLSSGCDLSTEKCGIILVSSAVLLS